MSEKNDFIRRIITFINFFNIWANGKDLTWSITGIQKSDTFYFVKIEVKSTNEMPVGSVFSRLTSFDPIDNYAYAEESFKLWLSKISTINEIEIRAKRKFNCYDEDMKMEYEIPLPFSFLRKHFVPETGKGLGDITARTEEVLESLLHSNLQKKNSVQEDPFDESDFADESPLKGLLGYTVGQNGMMKNKRQKLLYNFVKYTNIPTSSDWYLEWGEPNTFKRKQKTIKFLTAMARNGERKKRPPKVAINHWREDSAFVSRIEIFPPSRDLDDEIPF